MRVNRHRRWELAGTHRAEYHRCRDDAVLPGYRATPAYTRTGDVPAEDAAWLTAVAANAGYVRLVGIGIAAAPRAPGMLPAGLAAAIERTAGQFATAAASVDAEQAA